MSHSGFLFFYLGIGIVGILIFMFSRTLNKAEEKKWKEETWFREWIYGPPGYFRAMGILMGFLLTVIGVIGLFGTLLFPSEN
ncbi:MAG: hypothetical protein ABIP78_00800 [Pyrinomonadaceae bacterium]